MVIDLSTEECFCKYKFDLQCKFGDVVIKYTDKLKYGKDVTNIEKDLLVMHSLLDIINGYDCRDIGLDCPTWNFISIFDIEKMIAKVYNLLNKYL